jgi:hypothetical protein
VTYTAAAAIKAARSKVGYRESGTNDTSFNRWLGSIPGYPHGGYGYPWCQSFQSWAAAQAGGRANVDYPKTAGCATAVAWFKSKGRWSTTPHVGDMVFYGPGGGTHVELVVKVASGTITTCGGNTSGSLNGAYHEGNGVYEKVVARSSSRIYGYGRPAYEEEDDMPTANEVAKAVLNLDGEIEVPGASSKNKTWRLKSVQTEILARIDKLQGTVDAQRATIDKLVDALAGEQPDLDALKAEIRDAIGSIRVRLDVDDEPASEPAQP